MGARVEKIEVLEVELPFKREFRHALRARRSSGAVFVKVGLEDGTVGWGEALPREYVTGETAESVCGGLRRALGRGVVGRSFSGLEEAVRFLERLKARGGAAGCAAEMAVLDALGRFFGKSVSEVIGRPKRRVLFSSGVISADSPGRAAKSAMAMRLFGFKSIKLKVGLGDELKMLKAVRNVLGDKIDLRVDANCAWGAEEAIDNIGRMREFGITAVEQPVRRDDFRGLKKVSDSVPETIVADESLVTMRDAEKLAGTKACGMFNIRLSKCGGMLNALKIAGVARRAGIRCQLGCQVGESGVLAAAGRHVACAMESVEYYEGSYGTFLLKEDVTRENMTIGLGGRAKALLGPGLGVNVSEEALAKYTMNRFKIIEA